MMNFCCILDSLSSFFYIVSFPSHAKLELVIAGNIPCDTQQSICDMPLSVKIKYILSGGHENKQKLDGINNIQTVRLQNYTLDW